MSTVAIIPARGGSKGIKNKNIVLLDSKPLIYYVLQACFSCKEIDHVVLTTDSNEIAKVSKNLFTDLIIVKRPQPLATDNATSEDALIHAIMEIDKKIKDVENILFVQATSPLSESEDFSSMIKMLQNNDSVAFYTQDYGHFFEYHDMTKPRMPRQSRQPLTREAGNAWAFKKNGFMQYKSRLFGKIGLCEIDVNKSHEIDEIQDLLLIECLMQKRR